MANLNATTPALDAQALSQLSSDPNALMALIAALSGSRTTVSNPNTNRQLTVRRSAPSTSVEGERLRRHQDAMDDRRNALTRINPGLGTAAPIAAVLKSAAYLASRGHEEDTEEQLLQRVQAGMDEQARQQAEAAQAQRLYEEQQAAQNRETEWQDWQRKEQWKLDNQPQGPGYDADHEGKLRKELNDATKDFSLQNDAFGRVVSAAQDPSPAGDMALIFNYLKVLDPGSTVREGEFAAAQESGGWDDRIESARQQILSGRRLSDEQREDFLKRSHMLYQEGLQNYDKRVSGFRELLGNYDNVRPEAVIRDRGLYRDWQAPEQEQEQAGGVPEGTIVDGPDGSLILKNGEWVAYDG